MVHMKSSNDAVIRNFVTAICKPSMYMRRASPTHPGLSSLS